ncbi:hypothetical protein C8R43DRAFT_1150892 [Mycena crocata]|nr:hypothetical protein C8R43DRAFT_1150892 [Mycena crocata]
MNQFGSLSLRSSFHDTLRVLEIPDVTIIEEDLLRIRDSLVSLETLVIGDQLGFRDIPEHILITDTLLLRLTRTTDSQLIRRLKRFFCTSFMEFSADVYFNFVASRIASGEEPFRCGLRYLAYTLNEFDAVVHQKLLDLVQKGEVDFSIGKEEVP